MKCEQIEPYLPGYAGGDLRPDTAQIVARHVDGCRSCTAEIALQRRVIGGLGTLATREVEPPAFLVESIVERIDEPGLRRVLPMLPVPVTDAARVVAEHRDAIASAAGTALVAAGAAYALWRALRGSRSTQPAAS